MRFGPCIWLSRWGENMQTIKEYAAAQKISYEAARQQVARYRKELGPHIVKVGRTQYLDDDAIAYLREQRGKTPAAIVKDKNNDEIQALREQNNNLLIQVATLQDQVIKAQAEILAAKDEVARLQGQLIAMLDEPSASPPEDEAEAAHDLRDDEAEAGAMDEQPASPPEDDPTTAPPVDAPEIPRTFWQRLKWLLSGK